MNKRFFDENFIYKDETANIKLFSSPKDFEEKFNKYIDSCKLSRADKLRFSEDGESHDEITPREDKSGEIAYEWIRPPSIRGLMMYYNSSYSTWYYYYEKKEYKAVMNKFKDFVIAANEEVVYDKGKLAGAVRNLSRYGQLTPDKIQEMEVIEETSRLRREEMRIKREQHLLNKEKAQEEVKISKIKADILELQLERMKSTGEVDPKLNELLGILFKEEKNE